MRYASTNKFIIVILGNSLIVALLDIFNKGAIISQDDIVNAGVAFIFASLQGILVYLAKKILTEQETLKAVVQGTAVKLAQLDSDLRYIANEIAVLGNNSSTLSQRITDTEKSIATLLEWKRQQQN